MTRYTVYFNGEQVKSYDLEEPVIFIGRLPENQIPISNMGISRRHVKIEQDPYGTYTLTDLNSLNGTLVNGKKVKKVTLSNGDKIGIGKYTIVYEDMRGDASSHLETIVAEFRPEELQRMAAAAAGAPMPPPAHTPLMPPQAPYQQMPPPPRMTVSPQMMPHPQMVPQSPQMMPQSPQMVPPPPPQMMPSSHQMMPPSPQMMPQSPHMVPQSPHMVPPPQMMPSSHQMMPPPQMPPPQMPPPQMPPPQMMPPPPSSHHTMPQSAQMMPPHAMPQSQQMGPPPPQAAPTGSDDEENTSGAVLIETADHIVYRLDRDYITIGGGEGDDIYAAVNKNFAVIEQHDGDFHITAQKMMAKIKVNGKNLRTHRLEHRDRIEIGSSTFRFMENGQQ